MGGLPVPEGHNESCGCDHPFDDHILVAYEEPMDGGLMLCPANGCKCVNTWSVEGQEEGVMPPPHVIAEYRKSLGLT
jgi:hypothetical protein